MKKILGFLAVAGLLFVAAPAEQAQALSLANPAALATTKTASESLGVTTEVYYRRWHRHYGYHRHYGWHRHYGYHRRWHRRY